MDERKIEIRFKPINDNATYEMWERVREILEEAMDENLITEMGMTSG
jgi:hypothetical protein